MPDFDPCGFTLDLVRSCYRTKVRFFINRPDIETEVDWYFTDFATPTLPFPTRFASGNWASAKFTWPGAGEVLGRPRPWRSGSVNPGAIGLHPCGTPAQFLYGSYYPPLDFPRDAEGVPLCCSEPIVCCSLLPNTPDTFTVDPVDWSAFDPAYGVFNQSYILSRHLLTDDPCVWKGTGTDDTVVTLSPVGGNVWLLDWRTDPPTGVQAQAECHVFDFNVGCPGARIGFGPAFLSSVIGPVPGTFVTASLVAVRGCEFTGGCPNLALSVGIDAAYDPSF